MRRALLAAVLAISLAGVLSAPAAAATCTDEFTGPNEGQWTEATNWSAGVPGPTTVACWPSSITVLITEAKGQSADPASFQGGGLKLGNKEGLYFENPNGVSTLSGNYTQIELGYVRGPQTLEVGGAIEWASGQLAEHVAVIQGPGSSLTIPPGTQPYLIYGSSINTASPITITNPDFLTAYTSVTTSSTITLANGLDLFTEGGDNGTFTAAGVGPNSGPTYGFGADTLILTGGTTTVPSGETFESGPLTLQGGVLQDDGTIGESTYSESTELAPTSVTGGTLSGTGTVAGPLTNSGGTVAPGDAPGPLTVAGNYTQGSGGTLAVGIAGTTPGSEFDQLLVGGSATLGGTLSLTDEGGFTPALGDTFGILSDGPTREGTFETLAGSSADLYGVEYNPDGVTLTTNPPVVKNEPSPAANNSGSSSTSTSTSTSTTAVTSSVASTPKAIEEVLLGCTNSGLVLNDVYIRGERVLLRGSASTSLAGKKVKLLFNDGKQVAGATVATNGQFTTTAPLPPAKARTSLSTRYSAVIGKLHSLNLKLTRRLLLEAPTAKGTTVTLSGQVTLPLTKPIAPVAVEQQLQCGKGTIVKTFTPPPSGRFHITLTVPADAKAAIYRLTSKVAANLHAAAHGFATYSLPLPVVLG